MRCGVHVHMTLWDSQWSRLALSVEHSREVKSLSGFWHHWIIDDPGSNEPITQMRFPQNGTGLALNRRRNMRTGGMSEHDDRRLLVVDFIEVNVIRGVSSTVPFPCLSHRLCAREGRFPFDIKDMIWGHQRKQTLHISRIDAMEDRKSVV